MINSAHSCALVNNSTELLIVDKYTYDETYNKLEQFVERARHLEQEEKFAFKRDVFVQVGMQGICYGDRWEISSSRPGW